MVAARSAPVLAREMRRNQLGDLVKAGYIQREMAAAIGVSLATVNSDLQLLRGRWRETQTRDLEEAMALDLARLDDALKSITPAYRRGEVDAVDRLVRIVQLRRSILGYGAAPLAPNITVNNDNRTQVLVRQLLGFDGDLGELG